MIWSTRGGCYDSYQESREHRLTTGPAVSNPKALEGFMPRQKEGSDGWEWVKNGGIWQWMMGTTLTIPEAPFQQLRALSGSCGMWPKRFPRKTEGSDD